MVAASIGDEYRGLEHALREVFPGAAVEVSPSQSRGHTLAARADVHLASGHLHLRVELRHAVSRAQLIDAVELARLVQSHESSVIPVIASPYFMQPPGCHETPCSKDVVIFHDPNQGRILFNLLYFSDAVSTCERTERRLRWLLHTRDSHRKRRLADGRRRTERHLHTFSRHDLRDHLAPYYGRGAERVSCQARGPVPCGGRKSSGNGHARWRTHAHRSGLCVRRHPRPDERAARIARLRGADDRARRPGVRLSLGPRTAGFGGPFSNRVADAWALSTSVLLLVGMYVQGIASRIDLTPVPIGLLLLIAVVVVVWMLLLVVRKYVRSARKSPEAVAA